MAMTAQQARRIALSPAGISLADKIEASAICDRMIDKNPGDSTRKAWCSLARSIWDSCSDSDRQSFNRPTPQGVTGYRTRLMGIGRMDSPYTVLSRKFWIVDSPNRVTARGDNIRFADALRESTLSNGFFVICDDMTAPKVG